MILEKNKHIIRDMFNDISPHYDFLNHVLSFGMDIFWRIKLVRSMAINSNETILDAACGTGDLSCQFLKLHKKRNPNLVALDISPGMLQLAQKKTGNHNIRIVEGDVENLCFDTGTFDHVMIAFGIRNIENPDKGLQEMNRVLKPGGSLNILEFTIPQTFPMKVIFPFYFNKVLPFLGKVISGHVSAYTYLPESVNDFPRPKSFIDMLSKAGFSVIRANPLSGGICFMYQALKI